MRAKGVVFPSLVPFLFFLATAGLSRAVETPPLQKVILKIEGMNKQAPLEKIRAALLSVPGVKTVEFRTKKENNVIVEFEKGTLTSETLRNAVEWSSDRHNIYKVKFME